MSSHRRSVTDATASGLSGRSKEEQGSRGPLPKLPPSIAARSGKAKPGSATSTFGTSRGSATPLPHTPSEALGRARGLASAAVAPTLSSAARSEPEPTAARSGAMPDPAPVAIAAVPPAQEEEAAPASGVSLSEVPVALSDSEPPNSDETLVMNHSAFEGWFVRLDDASQGPLDEAVLRAHVSAGKIDESTPVWREGAQQWQPAGNYPGLFALIHAKKASLGPGVPANSAMPAAAVPTREAARSSALPNEADDTAVSRSVPAPKAAARSKAVISSMLPEAFSHLPGLPRRRMVPARHAWASTVTALGFGVAMGYLIWGASVPVVPSDAVAAAAADQAPLEPEGNEAQPEIEDVPAAVAETEPAEQADPSDPGTNPQRTQVSAAPGSKSPTPSSGKPEANSGSGGGLLAGLTGVAASGPRAPGSDSQSGRGGEGLDAAAIQRTVQRYQPSVRRSCWQRALSSRSALAPSSARVTVTIQVAASGKVTGVSHSGEPAGYPGLANCITSKVRGWSFPVAAGSTTANVPFVFAAQ